MRKIVAHFSMLLARSFGKCHDISQGVGWKRKWSHRVWTSSKSCWTNAHLADWADWEGVTWETWVTRLTRLGVEQNQEQRFPVNAGSRKPSIQKVQLVPFCELILEWDFVNFCQDCRVHVKISCTLCYSCTKTRNQYRHVQKFCSGSYYMNTGIWNHWTEFCMLLHTICKLVLFLRNSWNERGNWFTLKMHAV